MKIKNNHMQYDVIIIGSGLAGLAAGAKLSKLGKKVLIIEQHNIVGGCATTFKRKEYTFEVSLHELNGLAKTEQLYNLYQDLGALENLHFASAWTLPGGGFGATLGSGYMVANKILKRDKR